MKHSKKRRVFFAGLPLLGLLAVAAALPALTVLVKSPTTACAQTAPTACDPEYMDALEAKAYMEAQREITQNQNLILKPDSVLDYTCFLGMVNHLAAIPPIQFPGPGLFSEAGCCGGPGLGPTSLNQALSISVEQIVRNYIGAGGPGNFSHKYLAERIPSEKGPAERLDPYAGLPEGYIYACSEMQVVWNLAKCMNFFDNIEHDAFYDFNWYLQLDPRVGDEPSGPWSAGNMCPIGPFFASAPPEAFNEIQDRYMLPGENPWPPAGGPYLEDPVALFFDMTLPAGLAGGCFGPLPTGITVRRVNIAAYPDGICPNAGCHLTQDGGGCVP